MALPLRVSRSETARLVQLEILQRFEYDGNTMMSGVIAKSNSSETERAQVLIKGAPLDVSQLVEADTLPQDWAQVCEPLCQQHLAGTHALIIQCSPIHQSVFRALLNSASSMQMVCMHLSH